MTAAPLSDEARRRLAKKLILAGSALAALGLAFIGYLLVFYRR